jgi:Fe2+ transport protein
MLVRRALRSVAQRAVPIAVVSMIVAGCASANKTTSTTTSASSKTSTAANYSASGSSAMAGMNMGASGGTSTSVSAGGIKPVPTQLLGSTEWQGMKISAEATTPVPFVVYNGNSTQLVKPGKASFHLMVMLSDAQTGVAIPYSTVWATISKNDKIIFDERQWPMISKYMGPHYGNDVTVPGAGNYQLSLLVSPPVSARHVEYQNVWLKPHRVNFTFNWKPVS